MLLAALSYASKGIPVFPLHTPSPDGSCSCGNKNCSSIGKHPRTPNGSHIATTDEDQIWKWWDTWPDANLAIATGMLAVLDVDIDHAGGKFGDESLAGLEAEHGQLPATWVCLTGGGGLHYYFYCNDPALTVGVGLMPGLDFRAFGGYVVAPPSLHKSGKRYEWEASYDPEDEPAPAIIPDWLHDLFRKGKAAQESKPAHGLPNAVPEGGRNQEMFRLASSLRAKGLAVPEIEATLLKSNELRCDPPLSDSEVKKICSSVGKYEMGTNYSQTIASGTQWKPPDYTNAGNSEVFTRIYSEELIYTDALGWLYWNGKHWERNEHMATEYAKALSQEMLSDALELLSVATHKEADA